jgi:hypothetical protein
MASPTHTKRHPSLTLSPRPATPCSRLPTHPHPFWLGPKQALLMLTLSSVCTTFLRNSFSCFCAGFIALEEHLLAVAVLKPCTVFVALLLLCRPPWQRSGCIIRMRSGEADRRGGKGGSWLRLIYS